jgi:cysteinyl-tRNA synthetase
MSLVFYNTLSKREEEFVPLRLGEVRMYVCGPTVYAPCHLGHARPAVFFDVVRRYLSYRGYKVTYVTNFTDIDDKIIQRAAENKEDWKQLTAREIENYFRVMDALGVARADHYPRCTDHIPEMIALIQRLLEKKMAYVAPASPVQDGRRPPDGSVYFSAVDFSGYGKLSGRSAEDKEVFARVDREPGKKTAADFALWKASKPGEPWWDSPWGHGRPGWHIECSAMSRKHLGQPFDIHGGGVDLVFPHHENEIAQSEGAYGEQFARYWIHNAFVNVSGEKMAKSVGNVVDLEATLNKWGGPVIRMFLLGTHYRKTVDFTPEGLDSAKAGLERIWTALARGRAASSSPKARDSADAKAAEGANSAFVAAMDADLNTAQAVAAIFDGIAELNRRLDTSRAADALAYALDGLVKVLGLPVDRPQSADAGERERIEKMIAERASLRSQKRFGEADRLRQELTALGVEVEDLPGGKWSWKKR